MSAVLRTGQRQFTPKAWSATSDPLVTSDASRGYRVGDIWVNTTTKVAFELVDATAGAAVWGQITGAMHPGFVSGQYYQFSGGSVASTILLTENKLFFSPFFVPTTRAFDRFGFEISTGAGAAQNEVRTGIYKNTSGKPGALLVDNGRTVVGTGTGAITVTIAQTLAPGWYWLAILSNRAPSGSATQPTLRGVGSEARGMLQYYIGSAAPLAAANIVGHYQHAETVADWTTYALPDPATAPTLEEAAAYPALWLRAA